MDRFAATAPRPQACVRSDRNALVPAPHTAPTTAGVLALVLLGGCITYTPDPLIPADEVQQLLARGETVVEQRPGPWGKEWFPLEVEVRLADGLGLGEACALALFHSPALLSARAEAKVAGAQVLQAGLLSNPELFLGPRISTRDSALIFPVAISWELPLWGTGAAERDAADAQHAERRLRAIEVELATLAQVREYFIRLARLQQEEALLATLATANDRIVAWVEGLQRAGGVDAVSLFLTRTEREEGSTALERVRTEAKGLRRELCLLIGLLPNAAVQPVLDAASSALPELPAADMKALLGRPAMKAAEATYAAAEAALRREIGKQYPNVRIGPEFESDRGDPTIGIGLGISLPLFDRNKGGIAAAEAARAAAREQYRNTLLLAAHAEARAREELEAAGRMLDAHTQGAFREADQAGQALAIRLGAGHVEVLEVLSAQRAIARVRARTFELQERVLIARLRAAVAGGLAWERPVARTDVEARQ